MNILRSYSPTPQSKEPALERATQKSIFDLGNASCFAMDAVDDDDDADAAGDDGYDPCGSPTADGGFLTRTDTNRDRTGGTMRELKQDWVNFDEAVQEANEPDPLTLDDAASGLFTHRANGDPFRPSFFW